MCRWVSEASSFPCCDLKKDNLLLAKSALLMGLSRLEIELMDRGTSVLVDLSRFECFDWLVLEILKAARQAAYSALVSKAGSVSARENV